jgi:hypothetical protein
VIVNGVDLDKKYSADDLAELHKSGRLRGITLQGYFWRHEMDGMGGWVHFTDPTANRMTPGSTGGQRIRAFEIPDPTPQMQADVANESPIRKRTPQERVASMMMRLMQGGLTEDVVKTVVGESWKEGTPLDGETIRRVAAHYLGAAEREVERTARQSTTRAGRKARREQERLEAQERRQWAKRQ